jgi:Fe2+ or Zn2+ uptake regulation protein
MADARLDELLGLLRERGGRVTSARRAIVTALLDAGGHVTAEELTAQVQGRLPDIHLSTVYRTLEILTDLGAVTHVHLGHGRAVFHLTDEAHQHLLCEECGAVIEAPDELFADLIGRVDREYGFALRPDHFALTGRCRACR